MGGKGRAGKTNMVRHESEDSVSVSETGSERQQQRDGGGGRKQSFHAPVHHRSNDVRTHTDGQLQCVPRICDDDLEVHWLTGEQCV